MKISKWLGGKKHTFENADEAEAFEKEFVESGKNIYTHFLDEEAAKKRMLELNVQQANQEVIDKLVDANAKLLKRLAALEKKMFPKSKTK